MELENTSTPKGTTTHKSCTSTADLPQKEHLTEEQEKQIQDFIENRFNKVL